MWMRAATTIGVAGLAGSPGRTSRLCLECRNRAGVGESRCDREPAPESCALPRGCCLYGPRAQHHDHRGQSPYRGQRWWPEARRVGPRPAPRRDGAAPRYYIPREDVRTELLRPTARKTACPFKGQASYWSAQVGEEIYKNLVWSYPTPIPNAGQIAGLMCFYNERVELTIGDEHQPGPKTPSWR